MILAVDIGNSNIKLGVFDADKLKYKDTISTNKSGLKEDYEKSLKGMFFEKNTDIKNINGVIISSVVPEITPIVKSAVEFLQCKTLLVNDFSTKIGLKITDTERKARGTDIIADVVAGIEKYKENFIIVDFGTAIVFDIVGKDKEMLGVSILPSQFTMTKVLSTSCSQLNMADIKGGVNVSGLTTFEAINGGIFWLVVYGVNGIVNKLKKEYNIEKVCLTGSTVKMFRDYMDFEHNFEENLTLEGIYHIWKLNEE